MTLLQSSVFSIDAVTLTVFLSLEETMKYVELLGLDVGLEHAGHGTKGYADLYTGVAGFRLGASPAAGKYCTLFLLGEACQYVGVERLQKLVTTLRDDEVRWQVARFDAAIDTQEFEVSAISEAQNAGAVQCAAKVFREIKQTQGGEVTGHTCYFGARSSTAMLRVYYKTDGTSFGDQPFTRVEMEYKKSRANLEFIRLITSPVEWWAELAAQSLRGFISVDAEWWSTWLETVASAWISLQRQIPSIQKTAKWLREQVAPTLAAYVGAVSFGDLDEMSAELLRLVQSGQKRMKKRHERLMLGYQGEVVQKFAVFSL